MEMRKKVNRGYRIFNIVASVIIGLFTLRKSFRHC